MNDHVNLNSLLGAVRNCDVCADKMLPTPNPVLRASASARLLIIGQAPGTKVHASGIPWDDLSGDRLRSWLGMEKEDFYSEQLVAIVPMGFCYPGKGKSGDLPPRPECAPKWHQAILDQLPQIQLTLLIGQYAQKYYLQKQFTSLTECVQQWERFLPEYFVLPHPSPRNQIWLKKNPWFTSSVVPKLRHKIEVLFA